MTAYRFMAAAGCIAAILLSGCAAGPSDGGGSPGSGATPVTKHLRIGVMSDVGAVPFLIARQQGFFESRGLDAEITVFKSAMDRDTALQTGNLDGAMSDMLSVILFAKAGAGVLMTSDTYGNYRMITSPALGASAFAGLDSARVGISSNTVIDLATETIASKMGFADRLVKIAIPQMPVRLEMLKAGELDAATLPEPLASAALLDGGAFVADTEGSGLYPAVFLMTREALSRDRQAAVLMYEAYDEAVEYINGTATEELMDFLVEELAFPSTLKGHFSLPRFKPIRPADEASFGVISDWAVRAGLADTRYDYDALSDADVLP